MLELVLLLMLVVILGASQLFVNALEHLGHRAGISAGVTGSIFAAVATALPETTVPVVALVAGSSDVSLNEAVSVGAILGAPLMISTLSIFIMSLFAFSKRGWGDRFTPEYSGLCRDLNFFICAFVLAALALYLPFKPLIYRLLISFLLVALYLIYLRRTFKKSKQLVHEGHGVIPDEPLYLCKLGFKDNNRVIGLQMSLGLVLLLLGTKGFIWGIENISQIYHFSALLLSLLIIPIATELPEKVNSILWVRKRKDTLAFGNLTGAMVFQGTLLPALGVLLGPWEPSPTVLLGVGITLAAAIWLRLIASKKGIAIPLIFVNGFLYALYLYYTLV